MFNINPIIRVLIAFDIMGSSSVGFFTPIFAIFVISDIEGGSVQAVGFAWAIYWVVKSLVQLVVGRYLDQTKGEDDDLFSLTFGAFLLSFVLFLYTAIETKEELYMLQGFLGLASALIIPPWYAVFTRHVDRFKVGEEWAVDSTGMGLGVALAGALSGVVAEHFGFHTIFFIAGTGHFLAACFLVPLYARIKSRTRHVVIPERKMPY